jgi:catechol 2,3-dioxygenase-like lactoylglutathione lyase family enzyme
LGERIDVNSMLTSVSIGVQDAGRSLKFYADLLGFSEIANDNTAYREELEPVIGALLEARVITLNHESTGPSLQLIEHTSTKPLKRDEPPRWGDIGYLELGLSAYRLEELYLDLKSKGVDFITPVRSLEGVAEGRMRYAYLRDPDGLLLQLVEIPRTGRPRVGDDVTGGKEMELLILGPPPEDASYPVDAGPAIKLIHTPGYSGSSVMRARRWGDIGVAEMTFRVGGLDQKVNMALSRGIELFNLPVRTRQGQQEVLFVYLNAPDEGIIRLEERQGISAPPRGTFKKALNRLRGPMPGSPGATDKG